MSTTACVHPRTPIHFEGGEFALTIDRYALVPRMMLDRFPKGQINHLRSRRDANPVRC
jgi:hypothetical protein